MSYRFYSPQSKPLKSSLSLMHYLDYLQQHMTAPPKQEVNYQFQARLEILASRHGYPSSVLLNKN
ncbi:MAG: hypothetical protein AAF915_29100 [Cyanobacteria bacterium P01_D01_bin.50]